MVAEGSTGSMEIVGITSWGRGCARFEIRNNLINFQVNFDHFLGSNCLEFTQKSPITWDGKTRLISSQTLLN